jgi:hypothetical protein
MGLRILVKRCRRLNAECRILEPLILLILPRLVWEPRTDSCCKKAQNAHNNTSYLSRPKTILTAASISGARGRHSRSWGILSSACARRTCAGNSGFNWGDRSRSCSWGLTRSLRLGQRSGSLRTWTKARAVNLPASYPPNFRSRSAQATNGGLSWRAPDLTKTVWIAVTVTVGVESVPEVVDAGVLSRWNPALVQYAS